MKIRLLEQKDFEPVLSMMEVFYASDALLIHPDTETLKKTLSDAISAGPYLKGYGCLLCHCHQSFPQPLSS